MTSPTIVTVPCFSGAPWDLESLEPLAHRRLQTMRLPEAVSDMERYVDFVADQTSDLDDYVLVGDSFGAVVALGLAVRQPSGLRGLVLSGGFAADPVGSPLARAKIAAARFLPGPLYRQVTLRFHAATLSSPHDGDGQVPLDRSDFRALFLDNTPWRSYVGRARAAFSVDYRSRLHRVEVPTLIITPSHDELIGPEAASIMLGGIPDAAEVVLPQTGHMFRFTHPRTYARAIEDFVASRHRQGWTSTHQHRTPMESRHHPAVARASGSASARSRRSMGPGSPQQSSARAEAEPTTAPWSWK